MPITHPIVAAGVQPDLATSLWIAAHWVWERRGTAKRQSFAFSEETITEMILLDLATMHPNEIQVLPFTKFQEAKTGADWEWCFYDRHRRRFTRMLIQAKVLDDSDKEYIHLDRYIGNSRVRQIDRLLSTSQHRGVPALYLFYNHLTDRSRIPSNACSCGRCSECWGCSTALGSAVNANLPDKSFDSIRMLSRPWVCLLCPQPTDPRARSGVADSAIAAMHQLGEFSRDAFRRRDRSFEMPRIPDEPSREPPPYFDQVERAGRIESPVERELFVSELAAENPGVDGIVLLTDARES